MGKSSPPTIGYLYYMGLHLGLCHGPVDSLLQIRAGGRTAWSGNLTSTQMFYIDARNLFGGDYKEGGLAGYAYIQMGEPGALPNVYLQRVQGVQQPAYRGLCCLVYSHGEVCSLNPYIKPWAVQLWRSVKGWSTTVWYPETANIVVQVESDVYDDASYTTNALGVSDNPFNPFFNVNNPTIATYNFAAARPVNCQNPAHIVYECITNTTWGLGYPVADIDDVSFRKAALQLFNEGFGMCVTWTQQDQIDKFVQAMCDHVGACFVVNPQTGLYQFKLIRFDYVAANLLVLDTTNIKELDFTRATPLNMVNEVQVGYVNANSGKTHKTPPAQNNANIANAGGIISQAKDYPGIPCGALALRVAMRDLASQGTPLSLIKIKVNRSAAATLTPGDVFLLNWAPLALTGIVYRVGEIDYGKLDDGTITLSAVEDVFGLPDSSYANVQQSQWLQYNPTPMPVLTRLPQEASYRDIAQIIGSTGLAQLPSGTTFAMVFAKKPGAISLNYDLWTSVGGALAKAANGETFSPYGQLVAGVPQAYTSVITLSTFVDMDAVKVGGACTIGTERCIVTNVVNTNPALWTVTVARGADDSVPHIWPAGTDVWFYERAEGVDKGQYVAGETWYAKELTRTSSALLTIDKAPQDALLLVGRPYKPIAPGQLLVNGTQYPTSFSGNVAIGWASRNRLTQLDTLVPTSAGNVTAEVGTTYNIGLYAETGTLIRTINQTALSYTYTAAMALADQSTVSPVPLWSRDFITPNFNDLGIFSDPASIYPVAQVNGNVLQLGGSATTDTIVQLIAAPSLADFEIEFDVQLHAIANAGIVFRNTYWGKSVAKWAYAAFISTQGMSTGYVYRGPNAASGTITQLGAIGYTPADTWVKMRVRMLGSTINVWVNDVLTTTVTDGTWTAAGGFGLYAAQASGVGGYAWFRNIRIRTLTARPLGNFKFTLAAAVAGVASYDSHNVTVYAHGWGLAYGTSWGN